MMDNRMIEDFAHRYGARVDYQRNRSSFQTYSRSIDYYDDNKSIVDIELSRIGFEHLIQMDNQAELDYRAGREEARMRSRYPALAEAYSKYKMLLELYK